MPSLTLTLALTLASGALLVAACASPPASPSAAPSTATPTPRVVEEHPTNVSSSTGGSHARLVLKADRERLVLGQNILLHMCVENVSDAPITIDVGGDYRGASRSLRFSMEVKDKQNTTLDDPDPSGFSMGGLGYSPEVKPNESWCQSLPIARYARIDLPGTYTFRVTHDLGWPKGTAPIGEIRLAFALPKDEVEADAVIREMEALPRDPNRSAGKVSIAYADFASLRYPIYLGPLMKRARAGNAEAIQAIGTIPNVEASKALITLLSSKDKAAAREAASTLAMRLPDPALTGALGARHPFANELTEQRKYLSRVGWSPDLELDVRQAGLDLLLSSDEQDLKVGAFMMEAVGRTQELGAVTNAFTRAITLANQTRNAERHVFPTRSGACQEMSRAVEMILARGGKPSAAPKTPGELVVWLVALPKASPRPADWEAVMMQALRHPTPYVRRIALEKLPEALPRAFEAEIATNLTGTDIDVQINAAEAAERSHLRSLAPKIAAILKTATDDWLIRSVTNRATELGARGAAVDALVGRLADPKVANIALDRLLDTFEQNGRTASTEITAAEGQKLQAVWRRFVATHRARIDSNETLSLDDPSVPRDLVPPGWRVSRNGKPDWPPLP